MEPSLCNGTLDVVFWALDGLAGTAILAGNLFTCIVLISSPALRKNYMNVFLLSLAISDTLMAILVAPGLAAFCDRCCENTMTKHCWVLTSVAEISFLAVILNLLAICYDRYMAVFKPLHYNLRMNKQHVLKVLLLVWGIPPLVALGRLTFGPSSNAHDNLHMNLVITIVFVFIPILILVLVNGMITRAIRKHRQRIHSFKSEIFSETLTAEAAREVQRNTWRKRRSGTMSCVLVSMVFVCCWLPRAFYNINFTMNIPPASRPLFAKLSMLLVLTQSFLNPCIYTVYRVEFRRAAKRVVEQVIARIQSALWSLS
ncbi:predicted protein [Nematostella vectensis]|uniref:G-protein coupled receptors family 1 profile domain-containing protein n=1 Tax=Nematostella vectensis TaxID=45351 RepID=A7SJT3_NEMVE|nr:predicted protein [Nematostella vectensis]|eukprot:XP_001628121.1 predicted protein [Nematostella vectensis]